MHRFLKKIQEADEHTKQKVLIVSTSVAMIIVIFVWLMYFNNIVSSGSASGEAESSAAEERVSVWETMRRGIGVIYGAFTSGAGRLGEVLQSPREYIVKPMK